MYQGTSGRQLIAVCAIQEQLQALAATVYKLKAAKDMRRYSAHSLRVGTCIQLHMVGKIDRFIQHTLCWKSAVFHVYLRNVAALAIQHNEAMACYDPDGGGTDAVAVLPELATAAA